jgi:protein-tyrosine phosphatase
MIDLHTHILPGWDDGAADQAQAEQMIAVAREDGISKIVLTPHVYRMTKHGDAPGDLKDRIQTFIKETKDLEVDFFPGAEVYVHEDMIPHIKAFGLTINRSSFVFIEFPAEHVTGGASKLVFQMLLDGLIPIISHPERNSTFAASPELLYDLIKQGALAQVTSQSITGGFGRRAQKAAETFLQHGLVQIIASDAHDAQARPPRLAEAVKTASKILGKAKAEAMVTTVPAAILENEQIPDLGEPDNPSKKGKRRSFFR